MNRRRRVTLTAMSRVVSFSADGWLYLLTAIVLRVSDTPGFHQYAELLIVEFVIERVIYIVMKNGLRCRRPGDFFEGFSSFIAPSDKFSFPSGHTSGAFLFSVVIGSAFPSVFPFVLVWAVLVASSRIFSGSSFSDRHFSGYRTWICYGAL